VSTGFSSIGASASSSGTSFSHNNYIKLTLISIKIK